MNRLILIDTSAWLFTLGPKPLPVIRQRVQELVEKNLAAITSPILFELLSGIQSRDNANRLAEYLSSLHVFALTPEEWLEGAEWTNILRNKGSKVKTIDALIAYKTFKHNLTLLHADNDLDQIAKICPVRVESYVKHTRQSFT